MKNTRYYQYPWLPVCLLVIMPFSVSTFCYQEWFLFVLGHYFISCYLARFEFSLTQAGIDHVVSLPAVSASEWVSPYPELGIDVECQPFCLAHYAESYSLYRYIHVTISAQQFCYDLFHR